MKLDNFGARIVYRAVSLQYARWAHSAKGSRLRAGRFNWVDLSANYFALEPETAYLEYQQENPEPLPVVIIGFNIEAQDVLDLRGPHGLGSPFTNWEDDWKDAALKLAPSCPSWDCTRELFKKNGTGLIYPSRANPKGNNIVVFPEDATSGKLTTKVIDPKGDIGVYASSVR